MSIEEVKKEYELEWMRLDGVEGVGITEEDGERSSSASKKVIVVYISKQTPEVKKIPDKIEGYPVIKKITGEFKAF